MAVRYGDAIAVKHVDAYDIFRWPEFQAFASRLGIKTLDQTSALTIRIALGEFVTINQKRMAVIEIEDESQRGMP